MLGLTDRGAEDGESEVRKVRRMGGRAEQPTGRGRRWNPC